MPLEFDATYRDGAIHPTTPLNLPDNAALHVVVVPQPAPFPTTREGVLAIRPQSPRFTAEEFKAHIKAHGVSVGSLPPDFSRADIYNDHD